MPEMNRASGSVTRVAGCPTQTDGLSVLVDALRGCYLAAAKGHWKTSWWKNWLHCIGAIGECLAPNAE